MKPQTRWSPLGEQALSGSGRTPPGARLISLVLFAALVALFLAPSALARQETYILYAWAVADPPDPWFDHPEAEGPPDATNNNNFAYNTGSSNTDPLTATTFDDLFLPPGQTITGVWIDVRARYNAGTTNNRIRLEPTGSVAGGPITATWSQASGDVAFQWRLGGPNGADITARRTSWSETDVQNINLSVWRVSGTTRLAVDAFRIVVRTELDTDGDGDPDLADLDDDNDGASDAVDCAPTNPAVWRNLAYVDADGDGRGEGSPVDVGCFGAAPPSNYVLVGGDNCPNTPNAGQENCDGDAQGDACDVDDDNDGQFDWNDCAPCDASAWTTFAYRDSDGDGFTDRGTTVPCYGAVVPSGFTREPTDNCLFAFNPDQADAEGDGVGDACDPCPALSVSIDPDNDCLENSADNCPNNLNPDQRDTDGDGIGDVCDPCPLAPGTGPIDAPDTDGDGVVDGCDACPIIRNYGWFDPDCPPGVQAAVAFTGWSQSSFSASIGGEYRLGQQSASVEAVGQPGGNSGPWTSDAGIGGQTGGGIICFGCEGGLAAQLLTRVSFDLRGAELSARTSTRIAKLVDAGELIAFVSGSISASFAIDREICYIEQGTAGWQPLRTDFGVSPSNGRIGPGLYSLHLDAGDSVIWAPGTFDRIEERTWSMRFYLCDDPDTDADGYPDQWDNCPTTWNPDQADTTGCRAPDGVGDACQCAGDADRSGAVTFADVTAMLGAFGTSYCASPFQPACPPGTRCAGDANGDGVVSFLDITAVLSAFGASCEP